MLRSRRSARPATRLTPKSLEFSSRHDSDPKFPLTMWLTIRSLAWTILIPGLFAGYIPWRYFGLGDVQLNLLNPIHLVGAVCIGLGVVLLGACIWEFAHTGLGTLSPVDPPRKLVVRGLYRYVRNPMYLSVTVIVLGEFLLTRSRGLLVYWAIWFLGANLFVIGYEEPTLREQFGAAYDSYKKEVGRWLPRLRSVRRSHST
jgi:protein-S-isoprenylcysteine O-methyltransferase Ste14